jgi:membrane protease YdiL (CAAX protease family)
MVTSRTAHGSRVAVAGAVVCALALGAAPTVGRPWVALFPLALLPLAGACHARGDVPLRNAAIISALVPLTLLLPAGVWGWPAPALLVLLVALRPGLRGERGPVAWLRAGTLGMVGVAWAATIALVSGAALVTWYTLAHPDLADLTRNIRGVPLVALLGGGAVWATLNAFGEESIFRGALTEVAEAAFGPQPALAIQAVAFGAAHWHGVPRGVAGVLLATIYGLMLGLLRRRTRGLLAPIIAHVFADLVVLSFLIAAT